MSFEFKAINGVQSYVGDIWARRPGQATFGTTADTTNRVRPLRRARHAVEACGAFLALGLFQLLTVDRASALGGLIFRTVGPRLQEHRVADRNIRRALPHLTDAEIHSVLRGMWENLGRVVAEIPHLAEFALDRGRVEIIDSDGSLGALSRNGCGALIVSAHYGNWEIASISTLRAGLVQHTVYRPLNNPLVDRLIARYRAPTTYGEFVPKSRRGLWNIVAGLRRGEIVGMLVDQKLNEGVFVPFFGRDAKTTIAPVLLSRRFGVPILTAKVERLHGARFRVTISPFEPVGAKDGNEDPVERARRLNAILEDWVRERPDHWLWAHRRWPD